MANLFRIIFIYFFCLWMQQFICLIPDFLFKQIPSCYCCCWVSDIHTLNKRPSCTVTLSFAWCDAEFKNVTKALRIEEIFCLYLSTKWVDLRDTGNKLLLSVNSMIAAFVIYFCEQNWRRGIFFSSCLIFNSLTFL